MGHIVALDDVENISTSARGFKVATGTYVYEIKSKVFLVLNQLSFVP
jgi:hypothetical protein